MEGNKYEYMIYECRQRFHTNSLSFTQFQAFSFVTDIDKKYYSVFFVVIFVSSMTSKVSYRYNNAGIGGSCEGIK